MNRTLIITAAIAILGFTSCSAQQRQMYNNVTRDEPTKTEVVVATTLVGDPAPQGSCFAGEHEINGTCLPITSNTPPPTNPPTTAFSCPAGEVVDVDPSPHCVPHN